MAVLPALVAKPTGCGISLPGLWMVTFKQAAGFVLLGTVVWLLWILADQLDSWAA
jgi:thiol:disulfide interchange protein